MSHVQLSRRERPAKTALSRDAIVQAAVTLLGTEGLEQLTMRRLAVVLDTGPASLYVYVRNTEALHAAVLDELLGDVNLAGSGAWRDRLHALLRSYASVLFAYPSVARMSVFTRPSGPHYLRLLETLLGLLAAGGLGPKEQKWGLDLLLLHATSIAAEHGTRPGVAAEDSDLAVALSAASADTHPNLHRAVQAEDVALTGPERFDWAIDVMLDGLIAAGGRP